MTDKFMQEISSSATTPVDADLMLITTDVSTVPVSKKITWANIKATLKTYFDGLYQAVGSYMAYVAPSTSGNVLTSNGSAWVSSTPAVTSGGDGWTSDSSTWSYTSVDSPTGVITVNADMTNKIQKGMRIKYNQSEALTAYFPMDANSTSTVGSFTSTDVGTPTYTAGKFSNALTLVSASSQAVAITDTALMKPTGDFTIGCWFKTSASGTFTILMQSFSINTNRAGFYLGISGTNAINLQIGKNTGTTVNVDYFNFVGTTTVTDGNWHYAVATYRNNFAQLYLDGVLESSGYTSAPAYAGTNYVRIGCFNSAGTNASFFNGQIDDLFLINGYALDEETIRAKYLASTAQGTGNITVTKKAIVTNVGAWSGSAQLITAYHGTDHLLTSGAITNPHYSSVKVPFGFNINPDKWSVISVDYTLSTQASAVISTWYNLTGNMSISIPIGGWIGYYQANPQNRGVGAFGISTTFSTVNNAVSNANYTTFFFATLQYGTALTTKNIRLNLSAKTTHYLNISTPDAGTPAIGFQGTVSPTQILFTSSYL